MNIKLLSDKAKIPNRATDGSAGYDLYTTETVTLNPGEWHAFKTDIALSIPLGLYGRIAPRSGYAFKYALDTLAGVIDSDYRTEIKVILLNNSKTSLTFPMIKDGIESPIAQIIFESYTSHNFEVVENLDTTNRNAGFGSSDGKLRTEQELIQIRSSAPKIIEPSEPTNVEEKKYNQNLPYNTTAKSGILEKWNEVINSVSEPISKYEKVMKEREKV